MRSWIARASSLAAQVTIAQLAITSPSGEVQRVQSPAKQNSSPSPSEKYRGRLG